MGRGDRRSRYIAGMPNGDDYLDPDDRLILDLPLRALDEALADFAEVHGASVTPGNEITMPRRDIRAGDPDVSSSGAPERILRVVARFDFSNPRYDMWLIAFAHRGRDVFEKRRLLAGDVPDGLLAESFARLAEDGWREVATWSVDQLEPRP